MVSDEPSRTTVPAPAAPAARRGALAHRSLSSMAASIRADGGHQLRPRRLELPGALLQPLLAPLDLLRLGAPGAHVLERHPALLLLVRAVEQGDRDAALVGVLELLAHPLGGAQVELRRNPRPPQLEGQGQAVVGEGRIEDGDQHLGGGPALAGPAEVDEGGEQAVDADRGAGGGHLLAEEAHHQVVVAAAAEDRAELPRLVEHRLEDRPGVVGEAAGDRQVERHPVVAVAEGVEVAGDAGDDVDLLGRPLDAGEQLGELAHHLGPLLRADGEEALDAVHLVAGQPDAGDRVPRLVDVAGGQLAADLVRPHLLQLVEDAEDVGPLLGGDAGVGEQHVEDAAAGEAHRVGADLQGLQGVAHAGDDLGVGDLRDHPHRVEVELGELAEAPLVRLVGAPHRRHLVAAERARQVAVLGDHPRQRHGEIEAQAERFRLRPLDAEDRALRLLARRRAEQHVEVLDGRGGEGHEAVQLVDAADGVHHPLPGQQLGRHQVAQPLEQTGFDSRGHGKPLSRGLMRSVLIGVRRGVNVCLAGPPDPQSGALTT